MVDAFRERHGVDATILRLLSAERADPPGGEVTYLAEVAGPVTAQRWNGKVGDHPLRMPWARPGGPAADLAWADARLADLGRARSGPAVQIRTWNLSSLWRLACADGSVWLKVTPPFFAHEGAILAHLAGGPVPDASGPRRRPDPAGRGGARISTSPAADQPPAMIDILVDLQRTHLRRTGELLVLGLLDWRAEAMASAIAAVADRTAAKMAGDAARLRRFVDGLPARLAALAAAGPGETLIHSDFHPGNFRGLAGRLTLLDWGDSGVGHPLLDMTAFLDMLPAASHGALRAHWRRRWLEASPGMDFDRAASLIAPLAAAWRAAVFQAFLDAIEPSEHPYHAADPVMWLTRALDLAAAP